MALGLAGMAMIWLSTTAQAQYLNVYPSQDNPDSQTLWIFLDSLGSVANYGSSIRSSGGDNYHARDSWKLQHSHNITGATNFYVANKPTNQVLNLSPLFSSTNNPKDVESVRVRLASSPGFGPLSANNISFPTASPTHRQSASASRIKQSDGFL